MSDITSQIPAKNNMKEVAYWLTEFEKCKQVRRPFENQWFLNLAFYNGNQYVVWAPNNLPQSSQRLTTPPAPRYRVRLVVNKVKPAIRTEITKLTKEEPQFYVSPQTSEPSDLAAARISESVCVFILDKANFNRARRDSTFWLSICGTSYIKTFIVEDPDNAMESNIVIEPVPAFALYVPDIHETDIEKQPYVIHARTMNKELVEIMYGVSFKASQTGQNVNATAAANTTNDDSRFLNALGIRTSSFNQDYIFTMEIWVKPCPRYPNGALLVIADNKVIYTAQAPVEPQMMNPMDQAMNPDPMAQMGLAPGEQMTPQMDPVDQMLQALQGKIAQLDPSLPTYGYSESYYPFSHGMFPFAKMDHIPSGMFYSQSIIQDLIPIQRVYNSTRSQLVEIQNRVSKPQWTYTKGSIDPNKVTSEPGLMIPVNPGFERPAPLDPPSEPVIFQNEVDRSNADFDAVASQYEITKGRTPPGIEAASAISYLSELNDEKLYHTVASIEDATRTVGYQALILAQDFWDQQKVIKVSGMNGLQEAMQFVGADIKGNTDLRIEAGSMAPRSKTAKQAFITELIKLGVIPAEKGLRYLEMAETNQLYQESQADTRQAQRENTTMTQTGMVLPINPWDNNQVHYYEHSLYLKSQEFEALPEEKKAPHIQHFLLTRMEIQKEAMGYGADPNAAGAVDAGAGAGELVTAGSNGESGGGVPQEYS